MLIISILAAVAMPKFFTRGNFDVVGFQQEVLQSLRFAQKTAIAKRRLVCVTIASNALSLQFASSFGASACDTNLLDPTTNSAWSRSAPSGVSVTAATFNFDALGKPSFTAAQTLNVTSGSITQTVSIEAETGYVH